MDKLVDQQLNTISMWCEDLNCLIPEDIWPAIRHSLRTMYCTNPTDTEHNIFMNSLSLFKNPGFFKGYQPTQESNNNEKCF